MNQFIKYLFLTTFIFAFLFFKSSKGSHLVGGYISYEHLTGNDYKVNLHIFYDCFFAQQGDSLALCLKSTSLNYDSIIVMYYDTSHIFPYHPCLGSATSCLQGGTTWGISDNVFSCLVTLPNVASDWRFSAYVCCRNFAPITVNGANSAIVPVYVYASLDNLNFPFNNSPQFNNNLMPVFCLGVFTINDFNCTDPDGDSLVYKIDSTFFRFPCSSDSAFSVEYLAPYSYLNFLDSSTPLTMNSSTGALSFTPSMIENSIYSIRVDEYRNGLIIGSFVRQEEIIIVPATNGVSFIDDNEYNFFIYPNPTTDKIIIKTSNNELSEINLYDMTSRKILQRKFTNSLTLSIEQLAKGLYLYEVRNKNGVIKKGKIIHR